jgi:hypothetical protein
VKILFVNRFEKPDYLNDMIYHGLINSPGVFVYESSWPGYMLKGHPNPNALYGRGFTLYARMTHHPMVSSPSRIEEKIHDKFYDYIIYGSIARCADFLPVVQRIYPKNKIVFLDGEDWPAITRHTLLNCGFYFKRELVMSMREVKPISFSIPSEHVVQAVPEKTKMVAGINPSFDKSYTFDSEQDYYAEYRRSFYGKTKKKAGFDCLRHYEILANGCMPIFEGIAHLPDTVMTRFPKQTVKNVTKLVEANPEVELANYKEVMSELLDYTRENLTTVKEAARLLETITA